MDNLKEEKIEKILFKIYFLNLTYQIKNCQGEKKMVEVPMNFLNKFLLKVLLGKVPKTTRGGTLNFFRGANFGQKWWGNTFYPGMGGHEILTLNFVCFKKIL